MKHKLFLSAVLSFCAIIALAQPSKVSMKPAVTSKAKTVKTMPVAVKISLGLPSYEYKSDNGHVDISYSRSKTEKDDIRPDVTPSKAAMCLTKEEVRGQKVENTQVIADPSAAAQILPGGIIDADVLLKSGQFRYIMMDKRKPVALSISSNLAIKSTATINPGRNNDITDELRTKVHSLTRPSNLRGMPNMDTDEEVTVSTLQETMGIKIGASFFYLGSTVKNDFQFSSSKYRYMYVYRFEQTCFPVFYDGMISTASLFKEEVQAKNEWLFINEVQYGRRLFVVIESECDMEEYSNRLKGNLELAAVSAELSVKTKGSSLSQKVNIRTITQGGQPFHLVNPANIEAELDKYFKSKFNDMDIVPLAYKLTYLDGEPVSLISNAFLNGNNCLDNNRMKIRVSKVECVKVDDNKQSEEIYGSASIYYYNTDGKLVAPDGKTVLPVPPGISMKIPVATFTYGTKEAPIVLNLGKNSTKVYDAYQQGKYVDVTLSNLDMKIEIKPVVHEKDNVFNADDDYITEDRMYKTMREILLTGSNTPVFEFRRKNSVMKVYFEILPL